MYPEGVYKDGQQQGNKNEFAAAPASEASAPGYFAHFVPGFGRKRPIRAVLLVTAMVAVSYSLAQHHDHGPAQQVNAQLPAPASTTGSSSDDWNPPVGMDRSHEALDRLTLDLASAPQTLYPASGFQASGFQAEPPPVSLPAETPQQHADVAQQHADLEQPSSIQDTQEAPAAAAPERPADPSVSAPPAASHSPRSPRRKVVWRDEIDEYLWSVYQRSATKKDASGDFTWKDEAAAARLGVVTKQYVIGGMDPDFRELLYSLGHAMDADGISWTILSGFRDDYRQGLASGYKAHIGNSFHGGSRATGGYGHGCAADIEASDGEGSSNNAVWRWVDQHGEKFGIFRPMKQIDPAHIQPFGAWHDVALNLRTKDVQNAYLPASVDSTDAEKPPVTSLVETRSGVSEAQFDCMRSHGGHFRLAGHHGFPGSHMHRAVLFHGGRLHRFGRRRMIVIVNGTEKHASAETAPFAGQDGASAKAEASDNNRRDAVQHKVSDAGNQEKRQTSQGKVSQSKGSQSKEAAQSAGRVQRNATAPEAKGKSTKPQTVAAVKPQQRHAADTSERQAKVTQTKASHVKVNQAKVSEVKPGQPKAKNRVADHQDASSSSKKL
jgi:hypothetical protein